MLMTSELSLPLIVLLLTFVRTMLLTLKLTWSLDPNVGFSNFAKCNGRPVSPLICGWGWLEGSAYVEVDGDVVVDIHVDIYANVGNSRPGKMPQAPSVCLGGRCGRMAWTAGKTGRGMRPWPWAPRTLYKASCSGGGTLYKAQLCTQHNTQGLGSDGQMRNGRSGDWESDKKGLTRVKGPAAICHFVFPMFRQHRFLPKVFPWWGVWWGEPKMEHIRYIYTALFTRVPKCGVVSSTKRDWHVRGLDYHLWSRSWDL